MRIVDGYESLVIPSTARNLLLQEIGVLPKADPSSLFLLGMTDFSSVDS